MGFSIGIVGLPNVGKSMLFNALTKAGAASSNYPFCTIDPNVGIVHVPDERLNVLAKIHRSVKITPTTIEFIDIAGLVQGASEGEGLGNKFLSHIREVAAIAQVVRCFDDDNITHVSGSIDPLRDMEIINLELVLADLKTVEKRRDAEKKKAKSGDRKQLERTEMIEAIYQHLSAGKPVRTMIGIEQYRDILIELNLLTSKPLMYLANIAEDHASAPENNPYFSIVQQTAEKEGTLAVPISAKIEAELRELDDQGAQELLSALGLSESGLQKVITAGYKLLDLISYLTTGETETRAWTIRRSTRAPQAAAVIHTDFERGFIKAEIISYSDLVAAGSWTNARDIGRIRLEGKDYVMQEGDVVIYKFNV